MFQQSGLQIGPTIGNIDSNPAILIPDNGLAIAQVAQLQASLSQKHPLLGPGDLPQDHVEGLVNDLSARALSSSVNTQLAAKQDVIQENGLAQSKVNNLVAVLSQKVSSADLSNGLATKEPTITSLAQGKVANFID